MNRITIYHAVIFSSLIASNLILFGIFGFLNFTMAIIAGLGSGAITYLVFLIGRKYSNESMDFTYSLLISILWVILMGCMAYFSS